MGFRFNKRIKIAPGLRLNIGKKGVSTTLGIRGASVTYGHGKKRTNIGLPGTGISYSHIESSSNNQSVSLVRNPSPWIQAGKAILSIAGAVIVFIAVVLAAAASSNKRRR